MIAIVAAIARYCEAECTPERKCLSCVFVSYVPRVADYMGARKVSPANTFKAKVVNIDEWERRAR